MGSKVYLPLALAVFLAATAGADVIARTSIAGETLTSALNKHFYWAARQFNGTALLFTPFLVVAFLCGHMEKKTRRRSVVFVFVASMLTLLYFYFQGYQGAQHALLEEKWTAAALSVGLLPIFIGGPVVLAVIGAGALLARFDRRTID